MTKTFAAFKLDRNVQRQLNSIQKEFKQIKLPKNGGWMFWVGIAGIAVVAYLILTNKDLASPPVPIVDPFIDELGDLVPGIEGAGAEFLPDLPIGASTSKRTGLMNEDQVEAFAATVGERLSIA